jgi:hypothetical protein
MEPNTFLQSFNTEYQRWISSDVDYNTMRTETLVVKFLFCLSASNPKYDTLIQTVKNDALRNRVPLPSTVAAAAQLAQHWSVQPVSGHRETTFLSEDQLLKFEEKIMKKWKKKVSKSNQKSCVSKHKNDASDARKTKRGQVDTLPKRPCWAKLPDGSKRGQLHWFRDHNTAYQTPLAPNPSAPPKRGNSYGGIREYYAIRGAHRRLDDLEGRYCCR